MTQFRDYMATRPQYQQGGDVGAYGDSMKTWAQGIPGSLGFGGDQSMPAMPSTPPVPGATPANQQGGMGGWSRLAELLGRR
jgi:hypothetical protein